METMTLEYVRDLLASYGNTFMDAVHAVNAALRERNELRDMLDSARADRIREFRRANDESRRADKAESELAAVRKRIAQAPIDVVVEDAGLSGARGIIAGHVPSDLIGHCVRLLVENDDV